jgi:hypothetical protein
MDKKGEISNFEDSDGSGEHEASSKLDGVEIAALFQNMKLHFKAEYDSKILIFLDCLQVQCRTLCSLIA